MSNDFNDLTEAEVKLLREKFGIDFDTDNSLEEVQKQFEVTRERIRQIEAKALRKLAANKDDPKCSFCGKRASKVSRMIRSYYLEVHICDECVRTSIKLIDE